MSQSHVRANPSKFPSLAPLLVGFVPTDSLVLCCLTAGRVVCTARMDLECITCPDGPADLAATLERVSDRNTYDALIALIYTTESALVIPAFDAVVEAARLEILDACWVRPDGTWSSLCTASNGLVDYGIIPEEVRWSVMSSRDELARIVAGPSVEEPFDVGELSGRDLASALAEPAILDRDDALAFALALKDGPFFDSILARITMTTASRWMALAKSVVTHAAAGLAERPLLILGLAAWASGNGAVANLCVERLTVLGSESPFLTLLNAASARALPPSLWDGIRQCVLTTLDEGDEDA